MVERVVRAAAAGGDGLVVGEKCGLKLRCVFGLVAF